MKETDFIKLPPVGWTLKVVALKNEHRRPDIIDLAMVVCYLHGLNDRRRLDTACLNRFKINPKDAERGLQLMEEAGLVVVERPPNGNLAPVVIPLFNGGDTGAA